MFMMLMWEAIAFWMKLLNMNGADDKEQSLWKYCRGGPWDAHFITQNPFISVDK